MSKEQSGGEQFSIMENWKPRCPRLFFVAGTNTIHPGYDSLLEKTINEKFGGVWSESNLDFAAIYIMVSSENKAALTAMETNFKRKLSDAAWDKVGVKINTWISENQNFKADETAIAAVRDYFQQNPDATIEDFDAWANVHCDDARLWKQPRPADVLSLVKSIKARDRQDYENQLARLRNLYGDAPVDAALNELKAAMERGLQRDTSRETPEDKQKRYAKESAEAEKREAERQKKLDERAQVAAENVVRHFQGRSHGESFRVREQLNEIVVRKLDSSIDWLATAVKRAEFVHDYEHKNPAVINNLAR
jgi:hypothetical protein